MFVLFEPIVPQYIVHQTKLSMPSTGKEKANEKRSTQSGEISHIENLDVMLGSD